MNMLKKLFFGLLILSFLRLAFSCASTGRLQGGSKDSLPPVPLKSSPNNYSLNFSGSRIEVRFDEFFDLKNLKQELLISPPMAEEPVIKSTGKSLIIRIKDTLIANTTYAFDFGNSIVDYHEGNPLSGYKFVFSTGSELDSLKIAGSLLNAFDLSKTEKTELFLYKNLNDSAPLLQLPRYLCRADTAGRFVLENLKQGSYRIFALQDMNGNRIYDLPNEKIAFSDTIFSPQIETITHIDSLFSEKNKTDSIVYRNQYIYTPDTLQLLLFQEDRKKFYITSSARKQAWKCQITFSRTPWKGLHVLPLNVPEQDWAIQEFSPENDSLTLWLKDSTIYKNDSLSVLFNYQIKDSLGNFEPAVDTVALKFRVRKNQKKDSLFWKTNAAKKVELNSQIYLESTAPLRYFDSTHVHLYQLKDTSVFDTKEQKLLAAHRETKSEISLIFKRPLVNEAFLKLLDNNVIDWYSVSYNEKRDSVKLKITNESLQKLDTLRMTIFYDNLFFGENVQQFSEKLSLPLAPQYINFSQRDSLAVQLKFQQKLLNRPQAVVLNTDEKLRLPVINFTENKITYGLDSLLRLLDTLKLKITYRGIAEGKIIKYQSFLNLTKPRNSAKQKVIFRTSIPFSLRKDSSSLRRYFVNYIWESSAAYRLVIDSLAAQDMYDRFSKLLDNQFVMENSEAYGSILLKLKNVQSPLLIQLLSSKKERVLRQFDLSENAELNFDFLKAGNYLLKIIYDSNANKKWDTGNYLKKRQPERVLYYKAPIDLRANWKTEIEWELP